jgi:hypothetical protein
MKRYERFDDDTVPAAPIEAEVTIKMPPNAAKVSMNGKHSTSDGGGDAASSSKDQTSSLAVAASFFEDASFEDKPTFDLDGENEIDEFEDPAKPPLVGLNQE